MIWTDAGIVMEASVVHDSNAPSPMEVTDAGMVMEAILVCLNARVPISVHPVPSSKLVGEPAACHMALVKIVLPELYNIRPVVLDVKLKTLSTILARPSRSSNEPVRTETEQAPSAFDVGVNVVV